MHADILAPASVRTNDFSLSNGQGSWNRQRWTDFWISICWYCPAASRSATRHVNDRSLLVCMAMQVAFRILQQHHWMDTHFFCQKGRGPRLCTHIHALLLLTLRDLHCIAPVSLKHHGKKYVSSPPRRCENHTKKRENSGHGSWDCELFCELSFASCTYVYI